MTTTYGPIARSQATPFPAVPYSTAASYSRAYFEELAKAAAAMDPLSFDRATEVLLDAYTKGAIGLLMWKRWLGLRCQPPSV